MILSLTELDAPVFQRLSDRIMEGMKKLFETERTILWVTQGCRSEEPYMNMTIGLGRSLMLENPDLFMQFLDLETTAKPNPQLLVEALMRLRLGHNWEREGNLENVLWTNEHELAYENNALTISRIYHIKSYNDRYNASRRTILKMENPQTVPLDLSLSSSKYTLAHENCIADRMGDLQEIRERSEVLIKVRHSILMPVSTTPNCQLSLVLGTDVATDKSVIAFSTNNGSFVITPLQRTMEIDLPLNSEPRFLKYFEIQFRVAKIISFCPRDSTVVIHEPSVEVAASLLASISEANITVFFTTTSSLPLNHSWIKIDACSPRRVVRSVLPPNISVFIDSSTSTKDRKVASLISSCLPLACFQTTTSAIQTMQHGQDSPSAFLGLNLTLVCQRAMIEILNNAQTTPPASVTLENLIAQPEADKATSIVVDWSSSAKVPVQITSVDSQAIFNGDKSYVLFGLTSDLAQSLCDWMASRGARNIVLTSRTPKVDSKWVELMKNRGVRVEIFAK